MQETILHIQALSKRFGPNFALKSIDLTVKAQQIYGIIGMSGAGKSTLVRTLVGLEKPTSGTIELQGVNLSALDPQNLRLERKKLGMIFQHFNLFSSRNVIDNVAFPLEIEGVSRKERYLRAQEMLSIVGLIDKSLAYPSRLSGGEKQRVAIARALVHKPTLLLCDEATSALDPHTTQSILNLLSELNEKLNLTIVLITHEMDVVKQICTHVAVLEKGEIVEKGEVLELFSAPKHPTTKRFLQNYPFPLPQGIGGKAEVWHLSFKGQSAKEPLISKMIRSYAIEVNILMGNIDILKQGTLGFLLLAIHGDVEERRNARHFLEENGVIVESEGRAL